MGIRGVQEAQRHRIFDAAVVLVTGVLAASLVTVKQVHVAKPSAEHVTLNTPKKLAKPNTRGPASWA